MTGLHLVDRGPRSGDSADPHLVVDQLPGFRKRFVGDVDVDVAVVRLSLLATPARKNVSFLTLALDERSLLGT